MQLLLLIQQRTRQQRRELRQLLTLLSVQHPSMRQPSNTLQMKEMESRHWGMYLMAELAEAGVKDS